MRRVARFPCKYFTSRTHFSPSAPSTYEDPRPNIALLRVRIGSRVRAWSQGYVHAPNCRQLTLWELSRCPTLSTTCRFSHSPLAETRFHPHILARMASSQASQARLPLGVLHRDSICSVRWCRETPSVRSQTGGHGLPNELETNTVTGGKYTGVSCPRTLYHPRALSILLSWYTCNADAVSGSSISG